MRNDEHRPLPRREERGAATVIGFWGDLVEDNGPQDLVQALSLVDPGLQWSAEFPCEGPLRSQIELLTVELQVAPSVRFLPPCRPTDPPTIPAAWEVIFVSQHYLSKYGQMLSTVPPHAALLLRQAPGTGQQIAFQEDSVDYFPYAAGDIPCLARLLDFLLHRSPQTHRHTGSVPPPADRP